MSRTAAYIRVSTGGQNAASQHREIERWLTGHGINDAMYYVDRKTGDTLDRPEFNRLQAAVFNGEVRTIVVYKLDRIARTMQDGVNTVCEWCKTGIRLVCVTQQLDFSGTIGKAMAAVAFAFAEMEQQTRRERQAAGIAAVLADPELRVQKYKGRKPGTFKAQPSEVLRLRQKGLTGREIGKQLGISRATVQRYLRVG